MSVLALSSKIVLRVLCLLMIRKLLLVLTHANCVVKISFDLVYHMIVCCHLSTSECSACL